MQNNTKQRKPQSKSETLTKTYTKQRQSHIKSKTINKTNPFSPHSSDPPFILLQISVSPKTLFENSGTRTLKLRNVLPWSHLVSAIVSRGLGKRLQINKRWQNRTDEARGNGREWRESRGERCKCSKETFGLHCAPWLCLPQTCKANQNRNLAVAVWETGGQKGHRRLWPRGKGIMSRMQKKIKDTYPEYLSRLYWNRVVSMFMLALTRALLIPGGELCASGGFVPRIAHHGNTRVGRLPRLTGPPQSALMNYIRSCEVTRGHTAISRHAIHSVITLRRGLMGADDVISFTQLLRIVLFGEKKYNMMVWAMFSREVTTMRVMSTLLSAEWQ